MIFQVKKLFLNLLLLLTIVFLSGCFQTADKLYKEGKALINKPETQSKGLEKLILFEKRFSGDLRAPEVVLAIAGIQLQQKNYSDAIGTFERLFKNYPVSPEAQKGMFLLGYAYYDQIGDKQKAKETLEEFLRKYPDSELAASAKTILDNLYIPIDQWPVMKQIEKNPDNKDIK